MDMRMARTGTWLAMGAFWGMACGFVGCTGGGSGNHAPQINALTAGTYVVAAGASVPLSVAASDSDGDTLTYEWSAPAGTVTPDATAGSAQWQAPSEPAPYTISVTVSDGVGASAVGAVTVVVTDMTLTNSAPVLTGPTPSPVGHVTKGQVVDLAASVTDPDGDALTYVWVASGGSVLGSGSTATWTAPSQAGTYTIQCIVIDSHGAAAQGQTTATVTDLEIIVW